MSFRHCDAMIQQPGKQTKIKPQLYALAYTSIDWADKLWLGSSAWLRAFISN
jgi:hypothetical protein